MPTADRRTVLRGLGAAALGAALPESIKRALAIEPNSETGTIQDVKHIVVLMQENRSFDHYFGTLRGVRGFSDPRAVTLASGNSVFQQPNASSTLLPNHPPEPLMGYQFIGDLPHGWSDAHAAWNNGNNDGWVAAKGTETMCFVDRTDIPFHYALADAFTICDNYHCSIMSATDPNRYYLFTGWVGQNGLATDTISQPFSATTPGTFDLAVGPSTGNGVLPGGPVVNNDEQGYNWLTYPERLEAAGVSWKFYQDVGVGLDPAGFEGFTDNPYIGNFGDNSVLYFLQYQNAQPGSPLFEKARTGTAIFNNGSFDGSDGASFFTDLRNDVMNNTLPEVSWIVAPQAYCEHPTFPPNWGAWYVSNVLEALISNPEVWASTVFIINFDENDGFFDHIVAPTAPASAAEGLSTVSTVNEIYPGVAGDPTDYPPGPYGLGARVPCLVVSPWSRGGYVCSQTFDHTSVIQFIEQRFGVMEPHITPWRRTVSGDLTAALDFKRPNTSLSPLPDTTDYRSFVSGSNLMPLTLAEIEAGQQPVGTLKLTVPTEQTMPVQEPGQRLARALPYQLQADASASIDSQHVTINFGNTGTAGAFFQVRTAADAINRGQGAGPWGYTVDPVARTISDQYRPTSGTSYDLSVYGPNGFFRRFAGGMTASSANLLVQSAYDTVNGGITVVVTNVGDELADVTIVDNYSGNMQQNGLAPGQSFPTVLSLAANSNWYDVSITVNADPSFIRHYAGHVETGEDSASDPLIGRSEA
jgi:phospholipase C